MSITNREEANKYYQLINGLVDEYVESHKIRPSKLRTYFKPNGDRFQKFLKKNGLDSVIGANQVLNDVIDDRVSEELDGVVTFESFKYFESDEFKVKSMRECLYKAIDKSTLEQEKILADYFDTNLSSIDIVDSHKHHFKVQDWEGDKKHVVIYSKEEFDVIRENLLDYFYEELSEKKIEVGKFELELSNLIDKKTFYEKLETKLNNSATTDIVTECLGDEWEFEGVESYHYLWVKL
jgi:hypothetical protein